MRSRIVAGLAAAFASVAAPATAQEAPFDPAWLGQPFDAVREQTPHTAWRETVGWSRTLDPWNAPSYATWAGISFDAVLQGERGVLDALILTYSADSSAQRCETAYASLIEALERDYGVFHWQPVEPNDPVERVGERSESLMLRERQGFLGRAQTVWMQDRGALVDVHGDLVDGACWLTVAFGWPPQNN